MKRTIVIAVLLISMFICAVGCSSEEPTTTCDACGSEATRSIGGTSAMLEQMGINIRKCENITSYIYSADLCDSCFESYGPVIDSPFPY